VLGYVGHVALRIGGNARARVRVLCVKGGGKGGEGRQARSSQVVSVQWRDTSLPASKKLPSGSMMIWRPWHLPARVWGVAHAVVAQCQREAKH
jgi:hypothetical protein